MALRQAGLVFRAEVAGNLVITPRAGEAFKVRRIFVSNPSAALQHVTIINDTARVGFFRVVGLGGSHLINPRSTEVANNVRGSNIIDWMSRYNGFAGYPVVQGESLTITLDTGTADIFAVADSYDAADVKSTDTNGSKSQDILFVNYGTNLAAVVATGYNKVNSSRNPAEMPAFPFGNPGAGLVPSSKKASIYMIGGQAVARFVGAGATGQTQYIRPRVGASPAQTILDRNDVGIPFLGNIPGAGVDYTSVRQGICSCPRSFETMDDVIPDLDFNGNDELSLQVLTNIVGAGQLNAADIDIWCLMRVSNS